MPIANPHRKKGARSSKTSTPAKQTEKKSKKVASPKKKEKARPKEKKAPPKKKKASRKPPLPSFESVFVDSSMVEVELKIDAEASIETE